MPTNETNETLIEVRFHCDHQAAVTPKLEGIAGRDFDFHERDFPHDGTYDPWVTAGWYFKGASPAEAETLVQLLSEHCRAKVGGFSEENVTGRPPEAQ